MPRLSSPLERMKPHYTVVVVGSGYGGAIAASRLARAGQSVCVLERGKELQPGEYPDSALTAARELQVDTPAGHLGARTSLFDVHVNPDIHVVVGCGLGGTSLINANVSLRAEPRVFEDPRWPQALRADVPTLVEEGYRRAEEMLQPMPYPEDAPALPKLHAHAQAATALGGPWYRPPITVTFTDGVNPVGVEQHRCALCGDCVSGCNYGAKNTVLVNYLPDAKQHGAELYTHVAVRHLERRGSQWLVQYQLLEAGREQFAAPTLCVSADLVILAAGTLGSTEILLRSKALGLPLSERVGHQFTGNGDVLAFGYNTDAPINGIGFGQQQREGQAPVGPCITSVIDLRQQPHLEDGMVIEEGALPGALAGVLPLALATANAVIGQSPKRSPGDILKKQARELESLTRGTSHGAVQHTQTYLVMTHDNSAGVLSLEHDRVRIHWPGVGTQPMFQQVHDRLERLTTALGGAYIRNPLWSGLFKYNLVTVHPLGGCSMAEDAAGGVVNHKGQVFAGASGSAVYDNLYVCDGAVMPRSLGVNPLLTICALAERTCALLAHERGWTIGYTLPSAPSSAQTTAPRVGIQFTETMRGAFSTTVTDDYHAAARQGQSDGSPFTFTVTIRSDDVQQMLADPTHAAALMGTVNAPALSPHPLTISAGEFQLFVRDPDEPTTRQMRYRMVLHATDGRRYFFDGCKLLQGQSRFVLWQETTTLFITVHDGESAASPVLGKGVLTIAPADFAKQLRTLRVTNARSPSESLHTLATFGRFFAGALYDVYTPFRA